jgi:Rrf2 family nitric oxide-sensitive transcriptional repressor
MKLTSHTDYGLRVLMALAVNNDRLITIETLAELHKVSRNHLMKVAQSLVALGLVRSVRGRRGGLALAREPGTIRMGAVVRGLETDMELVACLGDGAATCVLSGACRLTDALRQAIEAFLAELDRLTLADLVAGRSAIHRRLAIAA